MLEPALGPVGIEDAGPAFRLWTSDGASLSVPKERVRVLGRWLSWLKAEWNGETVLMQFANTERAIDAVDLLRPEVAVAS